MSQSAAVALRATREPAPRSQVNSFDVFDTLIARRCIRPERIFDLVELRTGLRGFAAARVQAESEFSGKIYDLDLIYRALGERLGIEPGRLEAIKAEELAFEIENAIPIAENMAALQHGDLLVSDTYLSQEQIRRLLNAAGLDRQVSLVVTNYGKHSGFVWPKLLEIVDIANHIGDNPHSDIRSARQAGIKSRLTEVHRPNSIENTLLEIGLRDLSEAVRESRLIHWSEQPELRTLQLAQSCHNLPILTIASVQLLRLARRLKANRILFSSRDCNLWLPVFRALAQKQRHELDMQYFFTSRLARFRPSADYLDYARTLIDDRTIVVDLCGTGWSLAHLFEAIGRRDQPLVLLHQVRARADYELLAPTPNTASIYELLTDVASCNNTAIEMCNYAAHGMVLDVRCALGHRLPVFETDRRSASVMAAIEMQQAVAASYVGSLGKFGLRETLAASDEMLAAVGGALYKGLSGNHAVYGRYLAEHVQEDASARRALGCAD